VGCQSVRTVNEPVVTNLRLYAVCFPELRWYHHTLLAKLCAVLCAL
jgi:hypothetical protein